MSNDVKFDEEQSFIAEEHTESEASGLTRWVLKTGIVKTEKGANAVLVILAIVFFALSIYFFAGAF